MQQSTRPAFPDFLPESGRPFQVTAGVYWLRMPLPFALDHVNLWLLKDNGGWTIVDTGINTPESREIWEDIFARDMQGSRPEKVAITHYHPDHFGLSGWFEEKFGLIPHMTPPEYKAASLYINGNDALAAANTRRHYETAGYTGETLETLAKGFYSFRKNVMLPSSFEPLGDSLRMAGREWRIIRGHGHSPEHASYYSPDLNILISGDMVLPRITTNVSVSPGAPDANPMPTYTRSLEIIKESVPADALVLPSHNTPFYGLHARIDYLLAHTQERSERVMEILSAGPMTADDITVQLFSHRKLAVGDLYFALGETLAHLNALIAEGKISREASGAAALFSKK